MRIEFVPKEVGTHIIEASIGGTKLVGGPLIAKVYDAGLIQVTDVNGGVVGQPCQFRGTIQHKTLINLLHRLRSTQRQINSKMNKLMLI